VGISGNASTRSVANFVVKLRKKIEENADGANTETTLFVNGHEVGRHAGGYARFRFDVTSLVNVGGANVIAVKVSRTRTYPLGRLHLLRRPLSRREAGQRGSRAPRHGQLRVGKRNADQDVEPPLGKLGKASPAVCEERVGLRPTRIDPVHRQLVPGTRNFTGPTKQARPSLGVLGSLNPSGAPHDCADGRSSP
jgi:hypothetical protein